MWLGEFDLSQIVDHKFTTRGTTGAPTTLSGTPAISVYKSNSTTESTTGVTLTADFDSRTGLNHVRVDTSADPTFYATGTDFQIVITAGTVGGVSVVGEVVGSFTIRNRAGLKPATAGRTLVVDAAGLADANIVNIGGSALNAANAQIGVNVVRILGSTSAGAAGYMAPDWSAINAPTTTVNLSGTTIAQTQKVDVNTIKTQTVTCAAGVTVGAFVGQGIAAIGVNASGHVSRVVLCDTITSYTGNTPQTGDSYARIGATGSGLTSLASAANLSTLTGYVDTEVAAIKAKTDQLTFGVANALNANVTHWVANAAQTSGTNFYPLVAVGSFNDVPNDFESNVATLDAAGVNVGKYVGNSTAAIAVTVSGEVNVENISPDAMEAIADTLLDLSGGIETGLTLRQAMRLLAAAEAGKLSGAATTTITIRNAVADNKNRITAVVDSDGNRSGITYDLG